jgi:hypothetical protein
MRYCTIPSFGQPRFEFKGVNKDRGNFPSVKICSPSSKSPSILQIRGKLSEQLTEGGWVHAREQVSYEWSYLHCLFNQSQRTSEHLLKTHDIKVSREKVYNYKPR